MASEPTSPEDHKAIGFLRNSDPDPRVYHKVIQPSFNVGPSSARQQNAMAFRW